MASNVALLNPSLTGNRAWPHLYGRYQAQFDQQKQNEAQAAENVIEVQARRVDFEEAAARVDLGDSPKTQSATTSGRAAETGGATITAAEVEAVRASRPFMYEPAMIEGSVQLRTSPLKRGLLIDVMA